MGGHVVEQQYEPSEAQTGLTVLDNLLKRQSALLEDMEQSHHDSHHDPVDSESTYTATTTSLPISDDTDDIDAIIASLETALDSPHFESDTDATESLAPKPSKPLAEPKRVPKKRWITGAIFYLALVAVVVAAMGFMGRGNTPRNIFGYSTVSILTASMQGEIPQGSFVLTKRVAPGSLKIGNDITYMYNSTTSVTHKIVAIYEDYNKTGQRGFQTKGIENPEPDKEIVPASNVIGRVVWHVPGVGAVLQFFAVNFLLIIGSLAGIGVLIYLLYLTFRWMFRSNTTSSTDAAPSQEGNTPSPQKFPSCEGVTQRVEVVHMLA